MKAIATTDIRAEIAQRRQREARERRERVRSLSESDRRSEIARALFGTFNQPEDYGSDGVAAVARERVVEDADGEHRSSSARRGTVRKRVRIACECHVEWLCLREHITDDQKVTGMRFRSAWLASRHASRIAANYGERFGQTSGAMNEGEFRTDMRSLVNRMLSVLTPPQRRAVIAVCGEDHPAGLTVKTLKAGLEAIGAEMRRKR